MNLVLSARLPGKTPRLACNSGLTGLLTTLMLINRHCLRLLHLRASAAHAIADPLDQSVFQAMTAMMVSTASQVPQVIAELLHHLPRI